MLFDRAFKKRIVSGVAAVVMAVTNVLPVTSVYAAESDVSSSGTALSEIIDDTSDEKDAETTASEDTDSAKESSSDNEIGSCEPEQELCRRSIEAHPAPDTTVTLEGLMPEAAAAEVVDVTGIYADKLEEGSVMAAYDITITDGKDEFQPVDNEPIYVEISAPEISAGSDISLWHIHDDGTKEKVSGFTVSDGKVSFDASGFSAYVIVDEHMVISKDKGWIKVTDTAQLEELAQNGERFCISSVNGFFLKGEQYNVNDSRTGIKKKKPADADPNYAAESGAVCYYFDKQSSGKYYIYFVNDSGKKQYVNQSEKSLSLKNTPMEFEVAPHSNSDANDFCIIGKDGYCWNMQGGNNGKGFAAYNDLTDDNARIYLWHYVPLEDDEFELDGKTHGLMCLQGSASGNALMADDSAGELLISLAVREESGKKTVYITESSITTWSFETAGESKYYISAGSDGVKKYLNIVGDGTVALSSEKQAIKVFPGTGENSKKFMLISGGMALVYDNGFKAKKCLDITSSDSAWINFVDITEADSDSLIAYSAEKISVSDAEDGTPVIVYTRVWNKKDKKYDFYAVDHKGALVPCFERGDSIMWVGNSINSLEWDFTEYRDQYTNEINYYYELYNPYSKKYIAPQIYGGQVLSDSKVGISLPGRRQGEYYSDILAWDNAYYAFAGLRADIENNRVVSCAGAKAETFYFARLESDAHTLTKIETIDNNQFGVVMKMKDFKTRKEESDFLGNDGGGSLTTATDGLLSSDLKSDGYPTAKGGSLGKMFDGAQTVNHLFLESTYNASGYFEFDSCQNYATLVPENTQYESTSGERLFTVYKEIGTTDSESKYSLKHGQFMPYNDIKPGIYSKLNTENIYDALVKQLPESDPRKYEKLHLVKDPNYYNGMELEASFVQTPSGKDAWDHDMIFEFTGDDDFWFYVDGELVIDLGGIHSALAGNVNFCTGEVVVNGKKTDLLSVFKNNYVKRNPSATAEEIKEYLSKYFAKDKNGSYEKIFKDYSTHHMKIFYLERGAGASNLHMRFNLSAVTPGHVILSKKLTGTDDVDFDLVEFPYQIFYREKGAAEFRQLKNDDEHVYVTFTNSASRVTYEPAYTPPGSSAVYEGVYFLNPGKSMSVSFPENTYEYYIVECGINNEVYDRVSSNGTALTGTLHEGETKRYDFSTAPSTVEDRANLVFENHVDADALRTLSITKNLYDENGRLLSRSDDPTVFDFRLFLAPESADEPQLAYMQKYLVRDENSRLCSWDMSSQGFVSTSYTSYSALTEEQKETVTFYTSMNGAISKIPAGYTVEVPAVLVGTKFKVEERNSEIPLGYSFREYRRSDGSYIVTEGDTPNSGIVRSTQSPHMYVDNIRGFELNVRKKWSDSDYTESHGPVYAAVYVGNELVEGSIRQIKHPVNSARIFFPMIKEGYTFDDYSVREVVLSGTPEVDGEGRVINYSGTVTPLADGDLTAVDAVPNGSSSQKSFGYTVEYKKGEAKSSYGGTSMNTRTDTITNVRSGGVVITLFDMNTEEKLGGGEFVLKCGDSEIGTFTSDENGRVTILYDFDRDTEYTIHQAHSPEGYIGLPQDVTFSIGPDNSVDIDPNGTKWTKATSVPLTGDDKLIAYIDLYNKPFALKAVKLSKKDNKPLEGAHFALYNNVKSGLGGYIKDYEPMEGYEDLVSDENGIIPKIDNTLESGKYYLSEIRPPNNHEGIGSDVVITISELGEVSVHCDEIEQSVLFAAAEKETYCEYVINIPNTKLESSSVLTVAKTVRGTFGNKNREFTFTLIVSDAQASDEYEWTKNGAVQQTKLHSGDTFTLKHGDIAELILPTDSEVTLTEENENYTAFCTIGDLPGKNTNKAEFVLGEDTRVDFVNTLDPVIPTGADAGGCVTAALIFAAALAGAYFMLRRKEQDSD